MIMRKSFMPSTSLLNKLYNIKQTFLPKKVKWNKMKKDEKKIITIIIIIIISYNRKYQDAMSVKHSSCFF